MKLKWIFSLLGMAMLLSFAKAQVITDAEYYINKDPGAGNGMPVPVVDNANVEVNFVFSTAGLPTGNHTLYLRTKASDGLWSLHKEVPIYLQDTVTLESFSEPRSLVAAEFFVDKDPGMGKGTAIPINKAQNAVANFTISTEGLKLGAHQVLVRTQDSRGLWSVVAERQIGVLPSDRQYPVPRFAADTVNTGEMMTFANLSDSVDENITYAWDIYNDGSVEYTAESITHVFDTTGIIPVRLTATGDTTAYYIGHVIVGDFENRTITVNGSLQLCEGETTELVAPEGYTYEWNTGDTTQMLTVNESGSYFAYLTDLNGLTIKSKPVKVDVTPSFFATVEIQPTTAGMSNGFAEVFVSQVGGTGPEGVEKNASEYSYNWSTGVSGTSYLSELAAGAYSVDVAKGACSQSIPFTISENSTPAASDIVAAEYYWDTDPGVGEGTFLNASYGQTIKYQKEITTEGLAIGNHKLFVRTRANNGVWSQTGKIDVFIQDTVRNQSNQEDFYLVAAEYFVDTDPGVGNGTAIAVSGSVKAFDGSVNLNESDYSSGTHALYVRVKADNGIWSTYATQKFQVCGLLPPPPTVQDVQHCAGVSLTLGATGTSGNTYQWFSADSTLIDGQSAATYNLGAIHQDTVIFVAQVDAGGCQSQLSEINVEVRDLEVFAGIDETISLAGDPFVLESYFPEPGSWSGTGVSAGGEITRSSLNANTYTYTYSVDSSGCTFTSTKNVDVLDLQETLLFTMNENPPQDSVLTVLSFEEPIQEYTLVSGVDTALNISEDGSVSILSPSVFDFEAGASISFTINAKVDKHITYQRVLTIDLVNKADPPIIAAQSFMIDENSANGTIVGTIVATDQDSHTLAYSITSGNESGTFALQNTNELIISDSTLLDFETNPSFTVAVEVTDGAQTTTGLVTVSLNDINENQAPAIEAQTFTLAENSVQGTSVGTISASDPDGDELTYSITGGNESNAFALDASSGELTVADQTQLDFETTPSFGLSVQVSDGTESASATVTVDLSDVDESQNQAPQMSDQTFSVAEHSNNGTAVGAVIASDPDSDALSYAITNGNESNAFALDASSGELTVADQTQLDFETIPSFSLTVEVSDGELTASATIKVELTDVDESRNQAPQMSDQTFSVAENSNNGTAVGTVIASDPEGDELTYSIIAGNESNAFALDASSGELTVADQKQLDFETTPSFSLTVEVSDGTEFASATVSIDLSDVDEHQNQAPRIDDQDFSIVENSANEAVVGTLVATDPDGDALTYSITGGNGVFALDGSIGELTVADQSQLDFEITPSFSLTVEVSDGELTASAAVTIDLTDVDEEALGTKTMENGLIVIYPNPAKNKVTIEAVQQLVGALASVVDMSGKTLQTFNIKPVTVLALHEYPSGIYLIKVVQKDIITIKRITKAE